MFQLGILLVLSSRHMWLPRSLKSAIKRYLNITPLGGYILCLGTCIAVIATTADLAPIGLYHSRVESPPSYTMEYFNCYSVGSYIKLMRTSYGFMVGSSF